MMSGARPEVQGQTSRAVVDTAESRLSQDWIETLSGRSKLVIVSAGREPRIGTLRCRFIRRTIEIHGDLVATSVSGPRGDGVSLTGGGQNVGVDQAVEEAVEQFIPSCILLSQPLC